MSRVLNTSGGASAVTKSEPLHLPFCKDDSASLPGIKDSPTQQIEAHQVAQAEINNKSWYQRIAIPIFRILHQSPEIVRQQVGIIYGGYRELLLGMYEAYADHVGAGSKPAHFNETQVRNKQRAGLEPAPTEKYHPYRNNIFDVIKICYQKGIERSGNYIENYRIQCEKQRNINGLGSILGNTKEFSEGNAISDLINLHPVTAYANPVMEVADAAYDEALLALTNDLTKRFGGDEKLTYLELKGLQATDVNFIAGKYAFDVAKISGALAISPQLASTKGFSSGLNVAGGNLKSNIIFSGVISTGEELKRLSLPKTGVESKVFDLSESFANIAGNTLSNTANSIGMASLRRFHGGSHLLQTVDDLCDFLGSAKDASLTLDTTNPLSVIGHILVMGATTKDLLGDGPNDRNQYLKLPVSDTQDKAKSKTKEELEDIAIEHLINSNQLQFVTEFELQVLYKELGKGPNKNSILRGLTDKEEGIIYVRKIDDYFTLAEQRAVITHEFRHMMTRELSVRQEQRKEEIERLVEIRAQYQEELKLIAQGVKRIFYSDGSFEVVSLSKEEKLSQTFGLDYDSKRKLLATITKHVDDNYKPKDYLGRMAAAKEFSPEGQDLPDQEIDFDLINSLFGSSNTVPQVNPANKLIHDADYFGKRVLAALEVAREYNDHQRQEAAKLSDRLVCATKLPMQGGPHSLSECLSDIQKYIDQLLKDLKDRHQEKYPRYKKDLNQLTENGLSLGNEFQLFREAMEKFETEAKTKIVDLALLEEIKIAYLEFLHKTKRYFEDAQGLIQRLENDTSFTKDFSLNQVIAQFKTRSEYPRIINFLFELLDGSYKNVITSIRELLLNITKKDTTFSYGKSYAITSDSDRKKLPYSIELEVPTDLNNIPDYQLQCSETVLQEIVEIIILNAGFGIIKGAISRENRKIFLEISQIDAGQAIAIKFTNPGTISDSEELLAFDPQTGEQVLASINPQREFKGRRIFYPTIQYLVDSLGGSLRIYIKDASSLNWGETKTKVEIEIILPVIQVDIINLAEPDPQIKNVCNLLNVGDYDSLRNIEIAIDEGAITEEILQNPEVQETARKVLLEHTKSENYSCLGVILELINFSDAIKSDAEFQTNLKFAIKVLFKENYTYAAIRACKLLFSTEEVINDPETRDYAQKVFEKDFEYDRTDYDTGKELNQVFNFDHEVVTSCARKGVYFAVAEGRYELAKNLMEEYHLSSPLTPYHMDHLLVNALQENNSRSFETLLEMFPFPPEEEKEIFTRVIGDLAEHYHFEHLSKFISITKVEVSVVCAALLGAGLFELRKLSSRNILEDLARLNLPISFIAIVSMAIELGEDNISFDKDTTADKIVEEYIKRKIEVGDQEIEDIDLDTFPLLLYLVDPNFLSEKKLKRELFRLRNKLQEQTSAEDYIFDRVIHEIPELLMQSNRHSDPEHDAICVEKGALSLILINHFSITGEDILAYDRNVNSKQGSVLVELYQRVYLFLLQNSNFQAANIGKRLFYCRDQSNLPLPRELVNLCKILGVDSALSEAVEERLDHDSEIRYFLEYKVHEILTREDYQQGEKLNLSLSKVSLLRKHDIQLSELGKLKGTERNKFCRKIVECLYLHDDLYSDFVGKPLGRAAKYVGFETMIRFCYRVDTTPHDALLAIDPLIELLREAKIIGDETTESSVMRNLLEQINLDKARYGHQGSHAQLNKVIREITSTGISSLWRRLNEYRLTEEGHLVAGKLSSINSLEEVFSTWRNLKSFYEAFYLYKQRAINQELTNLKRQAEKEVDPERKEHLVKLRSFAIELLKSPVIELSAVEEFLLNPHKFWERWDIVGNTDLTPLLSVNELTKTASGLTSEELRAAFVSGTIDRLQLPALRIDYKTGPANRTLLELIREEILNLNQLQNGNREKTLNIRKGQLRAALKRKRVSFALQDYLVDEKGELDALLSVELQQLAQDSDLYNEIRRIVPIDEKESRFQIEVFLKSDPRGALAGNEVADCMPFGSRKDSIYKIYPFAQLMIRYQTEEGHWVTMAQSIIYLANDVGEISDHTIDRYSRVSPPEQVTNQKQRYLLLDNLQVAGNFRREQLLDKVRPLLADFLHQYQATFGEDLGINTSEVIIGAHYTPEIMFKNQRANTYLPLTMPSYTDNNLPQVFVLEAKECAGVVRRVEAPEKVAAKQYRVSSIPDVQPLSIWDSMAVAYVRMTSNSHRPGLIESLPILQNKIIATAIANEHRGKANLSFKFINPQSSKLEGYLLALECEKDLGEKGILIDDLSILAGESSETANQSLREAFSEAYQREYGKKGNVLPIFIKKNAKTTKQDIEALINILERQLGLRFKLEEKSVSQGITYFVLRQIEQ